MISEPVDLSPKRYVYPTPAGSDPRSGRTSYFLSRAPRPSCEHGETEPHMVERPCPEPERFPGGSCNVLHLSSCMGGHPEPEPFYIDEDQL